MTTLAETLLPGSVRPARYRIALTPDLDAFTFSGEAAIDLEVAAATDRIVLHALELSFGEVSVALAAGGFVRVREVVLDDAAETATLVLERPLPPGPAVLHARFAGALNDQLRGFYRSRYTGPGGEVRHLAATQFEATDARRAFPCWDEPAQKAVFEITLVVPEGLTALANTPALAETPVGNGLKAVRFAPTPRMSTYLVAFVVGDLACVEAPAAGGVQMRVWATRGKEEQGRYALEHAVRLLQYFNDYFGVPYPLPKLDHIAIPDFSAGAMENWGAITYRETALLFDPENSAAGTRQRILEVVSHEMAHMWFGDLVTMEWWDDLWLNESFASWMGDKAVDHLYPDWHMWTQFISYDTNAGLALDGLRNSHPIEVPVSHPAQIREIFDAISYSKGGSVLRMLEDFLGEDIFRRGLRAYIARHQYRNARTQDLWAALGEASGQPVAAIMGTWTQQMGYPLVSVRRDNGALHLSQRRFLYDGPEPAAARAPLWTIPVTLAHQGAAAGRPVVMDTPELRRSVPSGAVPGGWVKANWGQTGFYRSDYDPEDWDRLARAVERLELPPPDRLGLADDAYALVRAGLLPATRFLDLAEHYRNERDAVVWGDLAGSLYGLELLLLERPCLPLLDRLVRDLAAPAVADVGWEPRPGEGHLDVLLRGTVLGLAGAFGHPEVVAEAQRRFAGYVADPASLRPDLRAVVLGIAGQEGDRATYDTLWELALRSELQEEKLRLLRSLGRFRAPDLLRLTLERSLGPEVRSQDSVSVIGAVAANRRGRGLAWDFVRENWTELDRRYGRGGFAITSLVAFTGGFNTAERAAEVAAFFAAHPVPSAERAVQQALERIRLNVAWLERNDAAVAAWLDRRR